MRIFKKIVVTTLYIYVYISLLTFFSQLEDNYIWISLLTIVFIALFYFLFKGDKNKKCAWCSSRKIKFIEGNKGQWYWQYRNKDGSRDRRVKGNFQQASYYSKYLCNKCNAETHFNHLVNKKPSKYIKVWMRTLQSDGTVERTGTDWESKKVVSVNSNRANRKNN